MPGPVTINPDLTDVRLELGRHIFNLPILAAAMDAVVNPQFAIEYGRHGGLAVLNLEGLQCRFDDPDAVLAEVAAADQAGATAILQKAYMAPVRDDLVAERIREIKAADVPAAVSVTPASTKRLAPVSEDAGADFLVVQSTVTTARHESRSARGLIPARSGGTALHPGDRGEHRRLRERLGTAGGGHRRAAGWGRAGGGLHEP